MRLLVLQFQSRGSEDGHNSSSSSQCFHICCCECCSDLIHYLGSNLRDGRATAAQHCTVQHSTVRLVEATSLAGSISQRQSGYQWHAYGHYDPPFTPYPILQILQIVRSTDTTIHSPLLYPLHLTPPILNEFKLISVLLQSQCTYPDVPHCRLVTNQYRPKLCSVLRCASSTHF